MNSSTKKEMRLFNLMKNLRDRKKKKKKRKKKNLLSFQGPSPLVCPIFYTYHIWFLRVHPPPSVERWWCPPLFTFYTVSPMPLCCCDGSIIFLTNVIGIGIRYTLSSTHFHKLSSVTWQSIHCCWWTNSSTTRRSVVHQVSLVSFVRVRTCLRASSEDKHPVCTGNIRTCRTMSARHVLKFCPRDPLWRTFRGH
jgi:hypothetical protein